MSTKQKDSRLSTRLKKIGQEPPLASAYRHAVEYVCHEYTGVPESQYPRFIKRQKVLDKCDIAYDTYAYSVVKVWWPWCRSKAMRTVPANLFCGEKAWERFQDQHKTVAISNRYDDDYCAMLHNEAIVAGFYIGCNIMGQPTSWDDAVWLCKQFVSEHRPTQEIRQEVIGLLAELYNCDARSYDDIVEALRCHNSSPAPADSD